MSRSLAQRTRGPHYSETRRPHREVPAYARARPDDELASERAFEVVGLIRAGYNDREIAHLMGLDYAVVASLVASNPRAQAAIAQAKPAYKARLERSLGVLATGYTHEVEKVFSNGNRETVLEYVKPDFNAIRYVLENLDPEHWRTTKAVDLDMHGNVQVDVAEIPDARTMALATLAMLREAQQGPVIEAEANDD